MKLRFKAGDRVIYRKGGKGKPVRVALTVDCREWHSHATVRFPKEGHDCSVWVGELEAVKGSDE